MKRTQAAIFCASSNQIDPLFNQEARALVRGLHALGYEILSGGGAVGTMGAITDESIRCGGVHIAVLPRFMAGLENPGVTEVIWTDTMAQRKERMRRDADLVIALPGGIGTLDELIETHTLNKLDQYKGRLFALNLNGFYNPLIALLDHYAATGMTLKADIDRICFVDSVEELLSKL